MSDFLLSSSFASTNLGLRPAETIAKESSQISRSEDGKLTANPNLEKVADQFEAIFIETLLRQARQSKLSDGHFENNTDDNFEQMFDQELANKSSKSVDIGIAESIVRQMTRTGI